MSKTKKITVQGPLAWNKDKPGEPTHWQVLELTDSIEFKPLQYLTSDLIKGLCENGGWQVKVVRIK